MSELVPADHMTGPPLKKPHDYVFVELETQGVKHMFAGIGDEAPSHGDFTICGQKLVGQFRWAQRALALGKKPYCRECEVIYRSGMQ